MIGGDTSDTTQGCVVVDLTFVNILSGTSEMRLL